MELCYTDKKRTSKQENGRGNMEMEMETGCLRQGTIGTVGGKGWKTLINLLF